MATISSHVLDAVVGSHAAGIRVECYLLSGDGRKLVFDVTANSEGRINMEVGALKPEEQYELVFYAKDYFAKAPLPVQGDPVMTEVVTRLSVTSDHAKYHVPVVLSPHSYTVWWSAAPFTDRAV